MPQPYALVLVRKYYALFRIWIARILVYRFRIIIYFIEDGFHLVAFPFIWLAVYGARQSIAGFERADIVTYFIALGIVNTLATSHGGPRLRQEIMRGEINQNLVRPLHQLWFRFFHDIVYHVVLIVVSLSFVTIIKIFASPYVRLPSHPSTYIYFIIALFGSYTLSSCLELITGSMAFWFGETDGIRQARQMTETVLSGQIAPLIFFPLTIQTIANVLPFKFLAFIPAQIMLEKLSGPELQTAFLQLLIWCVVLITLLIFTWNRGLKTYEGVGI